MVQYHEGLEHYDDLLIRVQLFFVVEVSVLVGSLLQLVHASSYLTASRSHVHIVHVTIKAPESTSRWQVTLHSIRWQRAQLPESCFGGFRALATTTFGTRGSSVACKPELFELSVKNKLVSSHAQTPRRSFRENVKLPSASTARRGGSSILPAMDSMQRRSNLTLQQMGLVCQRLTANYICTVL